MEICNTPPGQSLCKERRIINTESAVSLSCTDTIRPLGVTMSTLQIIQKEIKSLENRNTHTVQVMREEILTDSRFMSPLYVFFKSKNYNLQTKLKDPNTSLPVT